jgi:hypothetical protein
MEELKKVLIKRITKEVEGETTANVQTLHALNALLGTVLTGIKGDFDMNKSVDR